MTAAVNRNVDQEIRQRMEAWKQTFQAKDVDGMMAFYASGDTFTAFDIMPPLEFHGGEMWRENWTSFFALWDGSPTIEMYDVRIHASGELAIFRAVAHLQGTTAGHEAEVWSRQTICLRRMDGQWLMIHNHISVPIDFATGHALLSLKPEQPTP